MKRILFIILISAIFVIVLFAYQSGKVADNNLRVVFCDVGQGDAIYIRTPGDVDILVDGGRNSRVLDCLTQYMPIFDKKIELVFATHPDADHIAGLIDVLENYHVESFGSVAAEKDTQIYRDLKALIAQYKIPYKDLTIGSSFALSDGVKIETFWPEAQFSSPDSNDYSLVQVLTYGNFDLLLTGDISLEILNTLNFGSTSIEVFKLPHHGSKTGMDDVTMQKIKSPLAIISAGKNNSYHHPHPSVLNLLNKYRVKYLRTDEGGSIELVTDGATTKIVN